MAQFEGTIDECARLLERALASLEASHTLLYAAAARRRLSEVRGGDEGRELIRQADAWMQGQNVKNPARMTAMLAPGWGRP